MLAGVLVGFFGPTVALVSLALIAAGFGVVRAPGLVFAAYLLLPFYKGWVIPFVPGDLTVILAALNGIQALWLIRGGWHHIRREAVILWLALTLVIAAGGVYASDQTESLPVVIEWLALVAIPSSAAVRVVSDARHVRQVVTAVLLFGILVVLLALPRLGGSARVVVLSMNTIQVAVVALSVPMVLSAYARGKIGRMALVVAVPLSVVVAIGSGSRGPLIAAIAVALAAIAVHIIQRGADRRTLGVVAVCGIGIAAAIAAGGSLPDASIARYATLVEALPGPDGGVAGGSVGARADLFGAAFDLFVNQPIFGNGTGAFAFHAGGTVGFTDLPYPHNLLLHAAADFGLIGVTLVVVLVVSSLRRSLPENSAWVAVRLLFAFQFAESLVSGDLYTARMLWGLLALLLFAPSVISPRTGDQQGA